MKSGTRLRSLGILAIATLIAQLGVLVPATGASAAVTGLDGTVTEALTGAPVSGAAVVIEFPDGSHWDFTNADDTGHFSFPGAVAGQYIVQVHQNGYIEQWLNGKPDRYSADLITAPATLSVALMPIQYGGIAGTITKPGSGGLPHVYLELRRDGNSFGSTATDGRGRYRFDNVQTGTYEMLVRYPSGHEVWYDNADEWNATPIEVTPNATTTIDIVRPPTGNLNIKAIDRTTRTPIANYCWYNQRAPYPFPTVCTDATGVAKLRAVPVGDYSGGGYDPAENYVNGLFGPVTVTEDHTSRAVVRLDRNSKLHVDFVDHSSGEAVHACVQLADPVRNDTGSGGRCGTSVDLSNLFPNEKFRLFAWAFDNVHGAQWVGRNGLGTGDPDKAKVYRTKPGEQISVAIKLDGAGSVTGTVRDAVTGDEVSGSICPTPTAPHASYGPNSLSDCTYQSGTYLIRNLGPYRWKLAFPNFSGGHAWVWSGNAPNRVQATAVKVVAGQTKTLDVSAPASAVISGQVTGPAGACIQCTTIYAVDATTGDYAGIMPNVSRDGTFTIKGLNTQDIWLYYTAGDDLVRHPTLFRTTAGATQSGVVISLP